MSLKQVLYFEIDCDDCGLSLGDISDYSAWRDPSEVKTRWEDADGFASDEWAFCRDHAPRCVHGYTQPSEEGEEPTCEVCADEIEQAQP